MSRRTLALVLVAATVLGFVGWLRWTRRQEDAGLRSAAMHVCTQTTGDLARCAASVERDHADCRLLATAYHGKGQGTTLNAGAFADCITRGPDVVRAERQALKKAQEAQRGNVLR